MLSLPLPRPVEMPQLFLSSSVDVQEGILDCLVRYQFITSSRNTKLSLKFYIFFQINSYINFVNHYNRNALPVTRGTLKEAPGRELVFLEHLQLVEEDIMEIHHAVFRVSCARVLLQVFQTSKLIFSLRLLELSNWKAFYVSQQHSLSHRFSDECYLDQDDQVTCTRCPPGYQVIEYNQTQRNT